MVGEFCSTHSLKQCTLILSQLMSPSSLSLVQPLSSMHSFTSLASPHSLMTRSHVHLGIISEDVQSTPEGADVTMQSDIHRETVAEGHTSTARQCECWRHVWTESCNRQ